MPKSHRLVEIAWPDFGPSELPPPISADEIAGRIDVLREAMAARGLTHVVIYGDREHMANIAWASGFDPRYEEALFVVRDGIAPLLVVGNECWDYLGVSPLYGAGRIRAERWQSFSLLSQPRGASRQLSSRKSPDLNMNAFHFAVWMPPSV